MKKLLLAGCAVLALGSVAHATEQQNLYCYGVGAGNQERVTFTRDAQTVYMHNEITGKDYQFPITRDYHALDKSGQLEFNAGDTDGNRIIHTDQYSIEYMSARGYNGWRFSCYHTPNEHPKTCVDFDGTLVQCDDLERRKANLRNIPPPRVQTQQDYCMRFFDVDLYLYRACLGN